MKQSIINNNKVLHSHNVWRAMEKVRKTRLNSTLDDKLVFWGGLALTILFLLEAFNLI